MRPAWLKNNIKNYETWAESRLGLMNTDEKEWKERNPH
jgi:hypothetical protein